MQVSAELPVALANMADVEAITAELRAIVASIPFPIWPGRAKHAKHIGVIPLINALFRMQLKAHGWSTTHVTNCGRRPDGFKQFGSIRVALEVQMANTARAAADLGKFCKLHTAGAVDLGFAILMDYQTAKLCASGVATFEGIKKLVQDGAHSAPTYVLGISQQLTPHVDVSDMGVLPQEIKHGANPRVCDRMAANILSGKGRVISPAQGHLF